MVVMIVEKAKDEGYTDIKQTDRKVDRSGFHATAITFAQSPSNVKRGSVAFTKDWSSR
jgi:hypothetical protein